MTKFSRENYLTDVLTVIGLVLIGAAVYLAFGLPAVLAYSGVVSIVVGVLLALAIEQRRSP